MYEFIKTRQSIESPFYKKLIFESQIFFDFIYRKMVPKSSQEIIDNKLVNDTMTSIRNKTTFFNKTSTRFFESSEYSKNERYVAPKLKALTEKEKIMIKNNIKKLNKKGQIILENSSSDISFKYIIFPQLDFDIYFNNENANEYHLPPNFSEKIESINSDIISKTSFIQNNNRSLEMTNYIYLTWMEVWAFTFSNIDNKERQYRFNQLIEIINKVFHHDMNILNLIFDALNRNSENDMILKLYQKILCLKINPSYFIYNIVSSIIDKEQLNELNNNFNNISNEFFDDSKFKFKNCNKSPNLKRTFSSVEDNLEINKTLKIYSNFYCIKCREKINLINICTNFSNIKNDILWVMCKCGQYNLPKITIKYGKELLRDNIYKTSYSDEIILYLPNNLKTNIENTIIENFGKDLIVTEFRSQFKPLFWNFFWYCKIHQLDYEILLPYLNDINELRSIKYKTRVKEIFEIVYEDKYYEENMDKIDKYSKNIYERFVNKTIQKKTSFKNLEEIKEIKLNYIPEIEIKEEHNELSKSEIVNNENIQNNEQEKNFENKIEEIKNDENKENNVDNKNNNEEKQNLEEENNIKEQEIQEEKEGGEKEEEDGEGEGEVVNETVEKKEEVNEIEVEKEVEQNEQAKELEEKEEKVEEQPQEVIEKEEEQKNEEEEQNMESNIGKNENIEEEEINDTKQEEINEIEIKEKINQEQNNINIEQSENQEINDQKEEEPKEECNIEEDINEDNNNEENIKTSELNIKLKKIKESTNNQMYNIEEINVDLKKIDESAFKKEPEVKKSTNLKLKKVDDQNLGQSTVSNVNSGETLIAELKKKLKKVGSTGV